MSTQGLGDFTFRVSLNTTFCGSLLLVL
jgi:hypothetical protein